MNRNIFTVIVTYNGADWIRKCIESVIQESSIIVIDNNSGDNTTEIIQTYYPEVRLLAQSENLGFGDANNLGIRLALQQGAEFIFLLNQDAWIVEGNIASMLAGFEKSTGIISPIHYSGEKGVLDFAFERYFGSENVSDWENNRLPPFLKIDFVNAAAWLVSADLFREFGGFHPAFYHYGEDREFVQRIQFYGKRILISSTCAICHDRPQDRASNEFFMPLESGKRKILLGLLQPGATLENRKRQLNRLLYKRMLTSFLKLKFSRINTLNQVRKYLHERYVFCKSHGIPAFDEIQDNVED